MEVSPESSLPTESSAQSTIDNDNISVPPQAPCGWLLSSPLTTIFSRMHIGNLLQPQQRETDDLTGRKDLECRTVSSQYSSDESPPRLSMSSTYSELSDSWVIEDLFSRDAFNGSLSHSHSSYGSTASQLEDEEQIWSLWDVTKDTISPEPLYQVTSKPNPTRQQAPKFPPRKPLPSQAQCQIVNAEHNSQLKRSTALRSPKRNAWTELPQSPTSPVSKARYSPFPPREPAASTQNHESHMRYNSWPLPAEPQAKPFLRARAHTSPVPVHVLPASRKISQPSNLSSCITYNADSQTKLSVISKPMFVQSAPSSPGFVPPPSQDFMDMMAETSAFSDDEDDDKEAEAPAFMHAMKSVLQLGRGTTSMEAEKSEKEPIDRVKREPPRRSLSGALNNLFKKKKVSTL